MLNDDVVELENGDANPTLISIKHSERNDPQNHFTYRHKGIPVCTQPNVWSAPSRVIEFRLGWPCGAKNINRKRGGTRRPAILGSTWNKARRKTSICDGQNMSGEIAESLLLTFPSLEWQGKEWVGGCRLTFG
ncbi:hypothetical protein CEXT_519591 [Caerostris extrusa]|uniref:Uncharacterized protein n=1 Tax=Caerostris extrusa TaxID=172846 RepID=A0AAV4TPN7_CAEEX|nr:hypothetical protein CEXT_519591 [Caerostris extrusa]